MQALIISSLLYGFIGSVGATLFIFGFNVLRMKMGF